MEEVSEEKDIDIHGFIASSSTKVSVKYHLTDNSKVPYKIQRGLKKHSHLHIRFHCPQHSTPPSDSPSKVPTHIGMHQLVCVSAQNS